MTNMINVMYGVGWAYIFCTAFAICLYVFDDGLGPIMGVLIGFTISVLWTWLVVEVETYIQTNYIRKGYWLRDEL